MRYANDQMISLSVIINAHAKYCLLKSYHGGADEQILHYVQGQSTPAR